MYYFLRPIRTHQDYDGCSVLHVSGEIRLETMGIIGSSLWTGVDCGSAIDASCEAGSLKKSQLQSSRGRAR